MEPLETAAQEEVGGKRLIKQVHTGRRIALGLLAALAAGYVGLCVWAGQSPTLYPGLSVYQHDLGGLTTEEATDKLIQQGQLPDSTPVQLFLVTFDDRQILLPESAPAELTFADLGGVQLDADAIAEQAMRYCHGNFFTKGWRYLRSLAGKAPLTAVLEAPKLREEAPALAERLSLPVTQPDYTLTADKLTVTVPRDGYTIDAETLEASIQAALKNHEYIVMDCPGTPVPAESPLTARALADQLSGEMRNAGYDSATDTFTPEQYHAEFDVPAAQALLDSAAPGALVEIPAVAELPTVFIDDLQSTLFRDLLGECTTHVGGSKGRKNNVRLSAEAFNNLVLNDREVFSYNRVVGQRTAEKGYSAAPAYFKGETVMEIGGGVCQSSSTLYLACLRADLEITARYAHRYIPAYIPAGMDATVSWGGPDYQFTNNTGYPIRLVTRYENDQVTVQIWGTNEDGTTVKMTHQHLSTTPYEVVYEDDPTLADGQEKVKVTPYTGYKYRTYRNRYNRDGKLISSAFEDTSDYKARNKVILRAPAPVTPEAPLPEPAPGPETSQQEPLPDGDVSLPEQSEAPDFVIQDPEQPDGI